MSSGLIVLLNELLFAKTRNINEMTNIGVDTCMC